MANSINTTQSKTPSCLSQLVAKYPRQIYGITGILGITAAIIFMVGQYLYLGNSVDPINPIAVWLPSILAALSGAAGIFNLILYQGATADEEAKERAARIKKSENSSGIPLVDMSKVTRKTVEEIVQ